MKESGRHWGRDCQPHHLCPFASLGLRDPREGGVASVARIFARTVETGSLKANDAVLHAQPSRAVIRHCREEVVLVRCGAARRIELQRAILFHRLDPRFTDLAGCIEPIAEQLDAESVGTPLRALYGVEALR